MSGLLLDTHVALWVLSGSPRLGPASRELITGGAAVLVSAASLWEMSIKAGLGKLELDGDMAGALEESGIQELAVTWRHACGLALVELPHRNPFDRLIAAQAQIEGLVLVTADTLLLESRLPSMHDARR